MKKLLALLILAGSLFAQSPPNYLNVTASNIHGTGNTLLASGTLIFSPVDINGNPISYQAGGGGAVVNYPTICTVTGGAIVSGCVLPNVSVTNPINVCFSTVIKDSNGNIILGGNSSGYTCIQPQTSSSWCTSGSCNFDQYVPNLPAAVTAMLAPPTVLSLGSIYAIQCTPPSVVEGYDTNGRPVCVTPAGGGTLTGITTGSPSGLTGGCTSGACNLSLLTSCASDQVEQWNGTAWICANGGGTGNVMGPGSSTANDIAAFNNTSGTSLLDSGVLFSSLVTQAANGTANQIPIYNATGKVLTPATTLPTAAMPGLTGDAQSTAGSLATTVKAINGVALSGLATGILKNTTTTGVPSIATPSDFPTLNQNTTGNAATATQLAATPTQCGGAQFAQGITTTGNANCATPPGGGNVSNSGTPSSGQLAQWINPTGIQGLATTGSGNAVLATSPALVTPALGAATATTINKVTLTQPATGSTLTLADGKTLTANNSLTLAGTDATTQTFPSSSGSVVTSASTPGGDLSGTYPNALNVKGINGVTLGSLATGILKNTTTTGVPSIAVAGDFPTLNQNTTGNAATATALAATPGQCGSNTFSTGVTASGAANCSNIPNGALVNSSLTISPATGGGLTGGGLVSLGGSLNIGLLTTCSTGQVLAWNGSAWACTAAGVGTITGVTAGNGLTGGGSSGGVALSLVAPVSLANGGSNNATYTSGLGLANNGTSFISSLQFAIDINAVAGASSASNKLCFNIKNAYAAFPNVNLTTGDTSGTQVCPATDVEGMLGTSTSGGPGTWGKLIIPQDMSIYCDGPSGGASGFYTDGNGSSYGTPCWLLPNQFKGIEGLSSDATTISGCGGLNSPVIGCTTAFPQRKFTPTSTTLVGTVLTVNVAEAITATNLTLGEPILISGLANPAPGYPASYVTGTTIAGAGSASFTISAPTGTGVCNPCTGSVAVALTPFIAGGPGGSGVPYSPAGRSNNNPSFRQTIKNFGCNEQQYAGVACIVMNNPQEQSEIQNVGVSNLGLGVGIAVYGNATDFGPVSQVTATTGGTNNACDYATVGFMFGVINRGIKGETFTSDSNCNGHKPVSGIQVDGGPMVVEGVNHDEGQQYMVNIGSQGTTTGVSVTDFFGAVNTGVSASTAVVHISNVSSSTADIYLRNIGFGGSASTYSVLHDGVTNCTDKYVESYEIGNDGWIKTNCVGGTFTKGTFMNATFPLDVKSGGNDNFTVNQSGNVNAGSGTFTGAVSVAGGLTSNVASPGTTSTVGLTVNNLAGTTVDLADFGITGTGILDKFNDTGAETVTGGVTINGTTSGSGTFNVTATGSQTTHTPGADGTQEVEFLKNNGSVFASFDSTNGQFAIGKAAAPNATLDVNNNLWVNASGKVTKVSGKTTASITPGVPGILAAFDQTGVSTAGSGTPQTVYTTSTAGHYRMFVYVDQNAPCSTAGSASLTFSAAWTDASHTRASGVTTLTALATTSTASFASQVYDMWAASGSTISVTPTYTACSSGTWTYDIHATVEETE